MDIEFKSEFGVSEPSDVENEYHLEIKIESLSLTQHQPPDIQLVFIFGDLVNKITANDSKSFDGSKQVYVVHSIPSGLSEKLLEMPIMLYVISLKDLKPLGSVLVEVKECFANAIKCYDFRSESIKKVAELKSGNEDFGKITFYFGVTKDIGNSNRHRQFYTESTKEKLTSTNRVASENN